LKSHFKRKMLVYEFQQVAEKLKGGSSSKVIVFLKKGRRNSGWEEKKRMGATQGTNWGFQGKL